MVLGSMVLRRDEKEGDVAIWKFGVVVLIGIEAKRVLHLF